MTASRGSITGGCDCDGWIAMRTLRLNTQEAEIRRMAETIEDFAKQYGVPPKAAHHVILSADELITNAIQHGGPRAGRRIMVTLCVLPSRLVVEIAYRGVPFDPIAEAPAPDVEASLDQRLVGGLGIHFAKTMLDGLSYVRRHGMNRVTLTKSF